MLKSIGEKANADTPLLECGKCYWLIPDSSLVPPFRKETGTSQKVPVYVPVMNSKDRFDFKSIGRPPVHSYLGPPTYMGAQPRRSTGCHTASALTASCRALHRSIKPRVGSPGADMEQDSASFVARPNPRRRSGQRCGGVLTLGVDLLAVAGVLARRRHRQRPAAGPDRELESRARVKKKDERKKKKRKEDGEKKSCPQNSLGSHCLSPGERR